MVSCANAERCRHCEAKWSHRFFLSFILPPNIHIHIHPFSPFASSLINRRTSYVCSIEIFWFLCFCFGDLKWKIEFLVESIRRFVYSPFRSWCCRFRLIPYLVNNVWTLFSIRRWNMWNFRYFRKRYFPSLRFQRNQHSTLHAIDDAYDVCRLDLGVIQLSKLNSAQNVVTICQHEYVSRDKVTQMDREIHMIEMRNSVTSSVSSRWQCACVCVEFIYNFRKNNLIQLDTLLMLWRRTQRTHITRADFNCVLHYHLCDINIYM